MIESNQYENENEGLFCKYLIQKADGTMLDDKAQYFVLRPDTDKVARVAIRAYAQSLDEEDAKLKKDLLKWMDELDASDACGGLRLRKALMRRQAARYGDGSAWEEWGR